MLLVHSCDIYSKGKNKWKYRYSIGVWELDAVNTTLKNM